MFPQFSWEDEMNHRMVRTGPAFLLLIALTFVFTAPANAQDAANLFKTKCAVCHGPDGSGNTPTGKAMGAADLRSDEAQKQTDAQLNDSITNGKNKKMPAYKGKLTDDQIKQLVAYIRDLAKSK
jgi:mono/diheme cytochrome c family protein